MNVVVTDGWTDAVESLALVEAEATDSFEATHAVVTMGLLGLQTLSRAS
jgi:hypothetical protein